jgi:amino acid transporter
VGDGAAPPVEKNELARRSVTGFEVFGQSLAATGPTISIGTLAVVYLIAGQGTMWSYILATVVAVLVGYSIAQFARRTAAAGSLYTYTASGLGRSTAFAGGWGLIFGYVLMAAACLAGAALYFGAFLAKLGLNGESRPWQLPLLVVFLVPTVAILIRGIRISTRVAVTLEIISLVAISVLLIALFVHYGARFDTGQFKATGSSATGIALGTVVAVSGFVGFESSSSLGIEARSPHRPPGPYNTFPYIFLAWIVIGLAWYLALKVRDPARAARLGTLQERETADLESRIAAELIPETESSPS